MYNVGETEHSTARFLAKKIPCDCLKDLKRDLKQGPKLTYCMNQSCQKEMEAHKFLICTKCGFARYCSSACQAMDWSDRHRIECKAMSQQRDDQEQAREAAFRHITTISEAIMGPKLSEACTVSVQEIEGDDPNSAPIETLVSLEFAS